MITTALILTAAENAALYASTEGQMFRARGRHIDAGPYAGHYFLFASIADDPAFAHLDFSSFAVVDDFDVSEAWLPEPEPEQAPEEQV